MTSINRLKIVLNVGRGVGVLVGERLTQSSNEVSLKVDALSFSALSMSFLMLACSVMSFGWRYSRNQCLPE